MKKTKLSLVGLAVLLLGEQVCMPSHGEAEDL